MKGIEAFCESVKMGFQDYGIKFLPRLFLFPFLFIAHLVLTAVQEKASRGQNIPIGENIRDAIRSIKGK